MRKRIKRIACSHLCRWGLTALAVLTLGATVGSWFRSASCGVEFATEHLWSRYNASFTNGRVWFCATPHASACFGGPPAEPEFWARFHGDTSSPLDWLGIPTSPVAGYREIWSTNGTEYWFYCSGFIPAAAAGLPAFVLWRRRRRYPAGGCPGCGYPVAGLTTDRCPECGNTVTAPAA